MSSGWTFLSFSSALCFWWWMVFWWSDLSKEKCLRIRRFSDIFGSRFLAFQVFFCRKSTVEVCSSYSHHVHLSNRSASRKLGWRKSIWRRYLHGFRVISFLFRRSYTISRLQKITSKAGQKAGLLIFYDMPAQQFVLESFIFLKQVVTDSKTFVDLFERWL